MVDFFVCEKIILKERMVSVRKIIKQEIQFEESLKQRIEFICEFSKVSPTFIKGSIRKIERTNYFMKINESQNDLACEIIIEIGNMDFWNDKDKQYRLRMIDVYNEQVNDLVKILPTFKIANATIHFDEASPHMHIVGVPIIENCTRGMKKQVGKSQLVTKESLTKIQDKMRTACIKSFNKFYDMEIQLKKAKRQKSRYKC